MATKFQTRGDCEAAINASQREYTSAIWVGPAAALADGVEPGWYAYCNDRRMLVL